MRNSFSAISAHLISMARSTNPKLKKPTNSQDDLTYIKLHYTPSVSQYIKKYFVSFYLSLSSFNATLIDLSILPLPIYCRERNNRMNRKNTEFHQK